MIKKLSGKWNEILYVCIVLVFIILFLSIHYSSKDSDDKSLYDGIELKSLITDWHVYVSSKDEGEKVFLPNEFDAMPSEVVSIKRYSENISDGMALCFKTEHTSVRVLIDNVEIYSFGWQDIPFGDSPGSKWHIVELTKEHKNKPIEIQFMSPYEDYSGNIPDIKIGTLGDANLYVQKVTNDAYILSFISLILGAILMGMFLLTSKITRIKPLVYLGLYMIINAIWGMAESGYLQFAQGNDFSNHILKSLMFLLMPVAMVMALKQIDLIKKHFAIVYGMVYGGAAVIVSMQLLEIYDFYEMIYWTHISLLAVCGIIFYDNYKEYIDKQKKNMELVFVALGILMGCVVWDMINFYTFASESNGYYIRVGSIVFVFILGIWAVSQMMEVYREGTKKEIFANMAYTDTMTGLFNRRAFDEDLQDIERDRTKAVVVMIDLNNLKTINDKLGHQSGDNAIKAISRRLKRFSEKYGEKCYRTGGDEFCVICKKMNVNDIISTCESINAELFESREVQGAILSMAYGYKAYDPYMYDTIEQVVTQADEMMYVKKQKMKAEMAARASN